MQPMQIFFDYPLANNANMPILIVEVEFMETLLDRLDRLQFAMWKADCDDEAARNLGTVIDCARQDLEDPDDDVDAGRYVMFTIDEYPALGDHWDAIKEVVDA